MFKIGPPDDTTLRGLAPGSVGSWGDHDTTRSRVDRARHGIPFPAAFGRQVNLKREFDRAFGVRPRGLDRALAQPGRPPEGTRHRGIDDDRDIARLANLILPRA